MALYLQLEAKAEGQAAAAPCRRRRGITESSITTIRTCYDTSKIVGIDLLGKHLQCRHSWLQLGKDHEGQR